MRVDELELLDMRTIGGNAISSSTSTDPRSWSTFECASSNRDRTIGCAIVFTGTVSAARDAKDGLKPSRNGSEKDERRDALVAVKDGSRSVESRVKL